MKHFLRNYTMYRAPEGAGGGGGGGGTGDGGAGAGGGAGGDDVFIAPWAEAKEAPWTINGKPWWDGVAEEPVRELMAQKQYKTPAELAVAYHNANKLVSADPSRTAIIPGPDSDEKAWDDFYAKKGRPAEPSAYEFKFEDGVTVNEKMVEFGKNIAFKLGLSPREAQIMAQEWNVADAAMAKELTEQMETQWREDNDKAIEALKAKYGAAWDENIQAGQRAFEAVKPHLSEGTVEAVERSIGGAALLEIFNALGGLAKEGKLTAAGGGAGAGAGDASNPAQMTPAQAQARIAEMSSDEAFQAKYTDPRHPEHKKAVEYMAALYERQTAKG